MPLVDLEEACKAVCPWCRIDEFAPGYEPTPAQKIGSLWFHVVDGLKTRQQACEAGLIRGLTKYAADGTLFRTL